MGNAAGVPGRLRMVFGQGEARDADRAGAERSGGGWKWLETDGPKRGRGANGEEGKYTEAVAPSNARRAHRAPSGARPVLPPGERRAYLWRRPRPARGAAV